MNKNKKALNKNLERLSSGYKINRAGDDAAGLALSEGMRAKIRGIDQAERNILDGIGLIHTAEGAMQEIHSMLQRAYELSVASSNGTYSDSNRECMQEEVEALLTELDRIAAHTEFNGIPVLQGFRVHKTTESYTYIGTPGTSAPFFPSWLKNDDGSLSAGRLNGSYKTTETYRDGKKYQIEHASATLDFNAIDTGADIDELIGVGFQTTCFTCPRYYGVEFVKDGLGSRMEEHGRDYLFKVDITGLRTAADVTKAVVDATHNGKPNNHFTVFKAEGGLLRIFDTRSTKAPPPGATDRNGWQNWDLADFNINYGTNPRGGKIGRIYSSVPVPPPLPGTPPRYIIT